MAEQEYSTPSEVAAKLRVSTDTVMRLLRTEQLRGEKVGRQWRIHEEAVREYLKGSKDNKATRGSRQENM